MIDISHARARQLLRESLDTRIAVQQWSALQYHLETCSNCKAFSRQLDRREKHLHAALKAGIGALPGPSAGVVQGVLRARRRRAVLRGQVFSMGSFLTAALILVLLVNGFRQRDPFVLPASAVAGASNGAQTPALTPIPTSQPGEFPGIVAYEVLTGESADIYLLNPGADPVNLTEHPAQDTDPAWSPDGAWLAFLSDRAASEDHPGKKELYLMSVAGTRTVQLTSAPDIDWQGPLTWSEDGQWISLGGSHLERSERGFYLVPVDHFVRQAAGVILLENTKGSWPQAGGFSDGHLSFEVSESDLVQVEYKYLRIRQAAALKIKSWVAHPWSGMDDSAAAETISSGTFAFNFPLTAPPVILPVTGAAGDQGRAEPCLHLYAVKNVIQKTPSLHAKSRGGPSRVSIAWISPDVFLSLADQSEFHRADTAGASQEDSAKLVRKISDICVESGLDPVSWTSSAGWLVIKGRLPGEADASLYAVQVPQDIFESRPSHLPPWTTIKLAGAVGVASIPVVQPVKNRVEINPEDLPSPPKKRDPHYVQPR